MADILTVQKPVAVQVIQPERCPVCHNNSVVPVVFPEFGVSMMHCPYCAYAYEICPDHRIRLVGDKCPECGYEYTEPEREE